MNAIVPLQPAWLREGAAAFLARYEGLRARLPGDAAIREAGAAAFRARGLPGVRDEAWHYTSLRTLAETRFAEPLTAVAACDALMARLPAIAAPRLVFVDGRFRDDLSVVPAGIAVRVGGPAYAALAQPARDHMVALNTMLAEDGAAIEVAAGTDGGTLLLANLGTGGTIDRPVAFHPRHAVQLGAGARLTLIEVAAGDGAYLHNAVMEATLGDAAVLTHLRLQEESRAAFHIATLYAEIGTGAAFEGFTLALGAALARHEVHARLAGHGAAAHVNAAQLLGGRQHGDVTSVITHDAPACISRQTVKNVLAGHARGVFQGRIAVARDAQKTDGYQMNQALLLSPDAEVNSKPELQVRADDVKCSHGATVGELDTEQLFYLRSRGIAETDARAMLVRAFLDEALAVIAHEDGRRALEAAIGRWWEREAA